MKILLLSAALNSGGVETGTVDLSKSLKDLGQDVIVVSSGGKLVQELEKYNIRHIQLPVHRKSLITFLQIPNIVKIIRKENIDVSMRRAVCRRGFVILPVKLQKLILSQVAMVTTPDIYLAR